MPASPGAVRCRFCEKVRLPLERAVAYGSYEGALRVLIHLLKFDQVRSASKLLGRMLAECIGALEPSLPPGKIAVIPVPLHAHKRAQRGFNQAELIFRNALKHLARGGESRFEPCPGVLLRARETGSQIGLTRHQRRENLRGAFAVTDGTSILNREVLLVDDVYTTGATASECTRVLLRAGAARVWVATVGRTMRFSDSRMETPDRSGEWEEADEEPSSQEKRETEWVGMRAQG